MPLERIRSGPRMSQAVVHSGVVYVSGQIAPEVKHAGVAEQTRVVLQKVEALLEEAGSGKDRLLSATLWLVDPADFDEMNAVWDGWLAPGAAPARATVGAGLMLPGLKVEIAVIAAAGDG